MCIRDSYKNTAKIKTLMKSIDETYNSTNTIKLLYANELLEEGSFDKSIEILDTISNTKSIVTNELVYSLKAKAFASKGLCSVSESYSKKITQHISIKEISNIHVSNCKNE